MQTGVRVGVLQKAVDVWYKELRPDQRECCYKSWQRVMDMPKTEDTVKLMDRFNPNNQYIVSIKDADVPCYKHKDKYYRNSMHWLPNDLIIKVEKV
jgi:hypothetical protein